MTWQDIVLSSAGAVFCAGIVPIVRDGRARVSRKASVPTAATLIAVAVAHATLGLYWTCITEAVCAGLWTHVAIFRAPGKPVDILKRLEAMRVGRGGDPLDPSKAQNP